MKARIRRSLILGAIGTGALASGIALGSFTAAGLNASVRPMNEMAQLLAFARQQAAEQAARQARAGRVDPASPAYDGPAAHVCQGCDAGQGRYAAVDPDDAVDDSGVDEGGGRR